MPGSLSRESGVAGVAGVAGVTGGSQVSNLQGTVAEQKRNTPQLAMGTQPFMLRQPEFSYTKGVQLHMVCILRGAWVVPPAPFIYSKSY